MTQPTFTPTEEQLTIIRAATETTDSLLVNALAGAAKTSTMVMVAEALAKQGAQSILALAFNVRIKEEMQRRLPAAVTSLTLNGLGHRAWAKLVRKRLELTTKKTSTLLKAKIKEQGLTDFDPDDFVKMLELISSCKSVGLVPKECDSKSPVRLVPDNDDTWERLCAECDINFSRPTIALAKSILIAGIEQAYNGVIDFDDQIYMSVCFNAAYDKYPTVLVDEAQDLSPMNHRQVVKSCGGRIIVLGDRHQSIYAFRGADPSSMDKLGELFSCRTLDLTTTFRCDRSICSFVREHVPFIKARTNADEGTVKSLTGKPFSIFDLEQPSAILCRNNAPLLGLASACMRHGLGVRVLGRDVGKGLTRALKAVEKAGGEGPLPEQIQSYFKREIATAELGKNFPKAKRLEDQLDCLVALCHGMDNPTFTKLVDLVTELFSDKLAPLTFATGHKSKGLEFDTVYHLDSWIIDRNIEKGTGIELVQEQNLRYVISTRAKHSLIFINSKDIEELKAKENQ